MEEVKTMNLSSFKDINHLLDSICPNFEADNNLSWEVSLVLRKKENPYSFKGGIKYLKRKIFKNKEQLELILKDFQDFIFDNNECAYAHNMFYQTNKPYMAARVFLKATPFKQDKVLATMLNTLSETLFQKADVHRDIYLKTIAKTSVRGSKSLWLVDYDNTELITFEETVLGFEKVTQVVHTYKTPNGGHVVLKPFNTELINSSDVEWKAPKQREIGQFAVTNHNDEVLFEVKKHPTYLLGY